MSIVFQQNSQFTGPVNADQENIGTTAQNDVKIYLNAVTGSDNKNGSTPNNAVKTYKRALSLCPPSHRGLLFFVFAPGTYDHSIDTVGVTPILNFGETLGPGGTPIVHIGGYTNVLGTKTVSAGSTGESITCVAAIVADAYYGYFITCTQGANAGQQVTCVGNTAGGTFYLNTPFLNPVSVGDKFRVEYPNVNLHLVGNFAFGGPVGFKGIEITNDPSVALGFGFIGFVGPVFFVFEGTVLNPVGTGFIPVHLSATWQTGLFFPWQGSTTNPFSSLNYGSGLVVKNAFIDFDKSGSESYVVWDSCFVAMDVNSDVFNYQTFSRSSSLGINLNSAFTNIGPDSNGPATVRGKIDGGGVAYGGFGTGGGQLLGVDFANSPGDCVYADTFSSVRLFDVGDGGGNNGYGLAVKNVGNATINPSTTVTGALGDVIIGAVPTTYAAIAAAVSVADAFGNRVTVV